VSPRRERDEAGQHGKRDRARSAGNDREHVHKLTTNRLNESGPHWVRSLGRLPARTKRPWLSARLCPRE
jgi:hypothetical protein